MAKRKGQTMIYKTLHPQAIIYKTLPVQSNPPKKPDELMCSGSVSSSCSTCSTCGITTTYE